jgi:hypothetical protein
MQAVNRYLVVSLVFLVVHPKIYLWGCLSELEQEHGSRKKFG